MKYLILYFMTFAASLSFANRCIPKTENCSYYACEEKHRRCGPHGYPLAFGFRFCQVFLNTENEYSPEAQLWLRKVRLCLMTSFKHINADPKKTCGAIRNDSFRAHVGCYRETRFCDLSFSDRLQVIWALRKTMIFHEAWRDGYSVMKACSNFRIEPNPVDPVAQK